MTLLRRKPQTVRLRNLSPTRQLCFLAHSLGARMVLGAIDGLTDWPTAASMSIKCV